MYVYPVDLNNSELITKYILIYSIISNWRECLRTVDIRSEVVYTLWISCSKYGKLSQFKMTLRVCFLIKRLKNECKYKLSRQFINL